MRTGYTIQPVKLIVHYSILWPNEIHKQAMAEQGHTRSLSSKLENRILF